MKDYDKQMMDALFPVSSHLLDILLERFTLGQDIWCPHPSAPKMKVATLQSPSPPAFDIPKS